jgi:hypothetical protein
LIATDGFDHYFAAVLRLIGPACVHGQVIKTRRNDRVVRVDRSVKTGMTGTVYPRRGFHFVRPRFYGLILDLDPTVFSDLAVRVHESRRL